MALYKVAFRNNKALFAEAVPIGLISDAKEFDITENKTFIKWYVVDAGNDKQAIEIANFLVKKNWGDILGL